MRTSIHSGRIIFLLTGFFLLLQPGVIRTQNIDPGYYYRLTNWWQGGKSLNAGANNKVNLANTANITGQFWKFTPLGGGYYRLTCEWLGEGKALDIDRDGRTPVLAETSVSSGQYWKVTPFGNKYRLTCQSQGDGKSIDVINDEHDNQLTLAANNDNYSGQFWVLAKDRAVPAPAPPTTAELKDAVASLKQVQREMAKLSDLSKTPLGPYNLYGKYTWCETKIIFCVEEKWVSCTSTLDFSWTKNQLTNVIAQSQRDANTVSGSYGPVENLLDKLPGISKKFQETTDLIESVKRDIKKGTGPTEQQRSSVSAALNSLSSDLKSCTTDLQNGVSSLATFLQKLSANRQTIKNTIEQTASKQKEAIKQADKKARETCDGRAVDQFQGQFNDIQRDFDKSINQISDAFQKLEESSRKAERGVAKLLGWVVNNQSEVKTIQEKLNAAKNDELGSFMQSIHLSTARKQWEAIARQ